MEAREGPGHSPWQTLVAAMLPCKSGCKAFSLRCLDYCTTRTTATSAYIQQEFWSKLKRRKRI